MEFVKVELEFSIFDGDVVCRVTAVESACQLVSVVAMMWWPQVDVLPSYFVD